jgi:hypothetical protein
MSIILLGHTTAPLSSQSDGQLQEKVSIWLKKMGELRNLCKPGEMTDRLGAYLTAKIGTAINPMSDKDDRKGFRMSIIKRRADRINESIQDGKYTFKDRPCHWKT